MTNWMHSIRTRLLIIAALMVLATATFVTLVAYDSAKRQVESSIQQRSSEAFSQLEDALKQRIGEGATVADLGDWLVENYAEENYRVYITSPEGIILADSKSTMVGEQMDTPTSPPSAVLSRAGRTVGLVYVQQTPGWAQGGWLQKLSRSSDSGSLLIVGGVLAAAVSIALVAALFQYLLHPVKDLTAAARAMAGGNLNQRVEISSRDELGELGQAFNAMAESLETDQKIQRNMITDIAHELRTPLTNIQGYLEAAQDGVVPTDDGLVTLLSDEAHLLSRLVQDLQKLSLAETGQLAIEPAEVIPFEATEEALQAFGAQSREKDITLVSTIDPNLPTVRVDPLRMAEILRNLLSNALRYTPDGGQVTVSANAEDDMVRFIVRDTGVGLEEQELIRVFDRLYRTDSARARATGGTGLGLTIVKQLVQAHGGEVGASSVLGEGSDFWFTLPQWNPSEA